MGWGQEAGAAGPCFPGVISPGLLPPQLLAGTGEARSPGWLPPPPLLVGNGEATIPGQLPFCSRQGTGRREALGSFPQFLARGGRGSPQVSGSLWGSQAPSRELQAELRDRAPYTAPLRSVEALLVRMCSTHPRRELWTSATAVIYCGGCKST